MQSTQARGEFDSHAAVRCWLSPSSSKDVKFAVVIAEHLSMHFDDHSAGFWLADLVH